MRPTRWLSLAAPVVAALLVVGAIVSIAARWPHQFGGQGDRGSMLADFVRSGTALAPPLPFLVLFVLVSVLVRRPDRWGTGARFVLLALSAVMIMASLGEAFAAPTPDVPRAVQVFSGVWGSAAGGLLLVLCVGSIVSGRSAASRRAPAS